MSHNFKSALSLLCLAFCATSINATPGSLDFPSKKDVNASALSEQPTDEIRKKRFEQGNANMNDFGKKGKPLPTNSDKNRFNRPLTKGSFLPPYSQDPTVSALFGLPTDTIRKNRFAKGNNYLAHSKELGKEQRPCLKEETLKKRLKPLIAEKQDARNVVALFIHETDLLKEIAKDPQTKQEVTQHVAQAMRRYDPSFNRENRITLDEYRKLAEQEAAIIQSLCKARK